MIPLILTTRRGNASDQDLGIATDGGGGAGAETETEGGAGVVRREVERRDRRDRESGRSQFQYPTRASDLRSLSLVAGDVPWTQPGTLTLRLQSGPGLLSDLMLWSSRRSVQVSCTDYSVQETVDLEIKIFFKQAWSELVS